MARLLVLLRVGGGAREVLLDVVARLLGLLAVAVHLAAAREQRLGRRALGIRDARLLDVVGKEVLVAEELALVAGVAHDALEVTVLVALVQHEPLLPLLVQLPLVDLLLHRVARDEPVDLDVVPLADAVRPVLRLHVATRVPVGVKDEHRRRADEVEAEAARLGREQEDELLVDGVERVHQLATLGGGRRAVEPQVDVPGQGWGWGSS